MRTKAIVTLVPIIAISITTESAIAQTQATTPAHECISVSQQGQSETSYQLTNDCGATIKISGQSEDNGICSAFDSQDGEDEIASGATFDITAPAQICVEYADRATQTASGYPGCGTISDCGTASNAITQTHPEKPKANIVLAPAGSLDIDEGTSGTFTVALSAAPVGSATVTLSKTNSDITLSETSLTFTSSNYNLAQTVTVAAAQDDDQADDEDTITLSAGGGIDAVDVTKSVGVVDDDVPPKGRIVVVSPPGTLIVDEGGSANLRIALSVAPNANTTVTLSKTNSDITLSETSLTFTSSNYDQAQSVVVSAAQDDDAVDDQDTITLSAAGGIDAANVTKSVSVEDDDPPPGDIVVTPAGTLSVEEGGSAVLSVALSDTPNDDTTVTLSKTNADITLSATSLTFTVDDYDQAQTITVSAAQDDDAIDDQDTITFSADGGIDAEDASKPVIVDDDDAPPAPAGNIVVTPAEALSIDEGGSVDLTVALSDAPNADVTVSITKTNSDITLSSASLTFTVDNYDQAQTVSVGAAEDDDAIDDEDTITFSAGGGIEAENVSRSVSVDDNDTPTPSGVMVVAPAREILIEEGSSGTLTVALSVAPTADVSVALSSPDSEITLTPASLIFTPDNHDQAQTVTVVVEHDDDSIDDEGRIILTASGGIIAPNETIAVLIEDDDGPSEGIDVSVANLKIDEGEFGTFTVRLASAPDADVAISFSFLSIGVQGLTISPSSLTFTSSNWDIEQTVTVSAGQDDDDDSYAAEMTLSASDGYPAADAKVFVEVSDDEANPVRAEIFFYPKDRVDIQEGNTFEYRLSLSQPPSSSAIVTLTTNSPKLTVSPYFLTFTSDDFSEERIATVTALFDDDETHNSYEIKAEPGPGLSSFPVMREVRVIDSIVEGPFLALESVDGGRPAINEGETGQFHVILGFQPPADVRINLSTDNPDIITLSPNEILIPRQDWELPHVFEVSAAADEDTENVDVRVNAFSTVAGREEDASLFIVIKDTTGADWAQQAQAPAIPPSNSVDHATLRVRCKQNTDCDAYLFCTSQDGDVFEGVLDPIPANGTLTLTAMDIEDITSGSWVGKGRLNCEIRGDGDLEAQVWTRSGDGVLVNNSPVIVSRFVEGLHVASIESISSPLTDEITNVRIRCDAPDGEDCTDTRLYCYDDTGVLRQVDLGTIDRYSVRHLQSSEIAELISYVWSGLGLSCDATSEQPFSVQVLTRTGSGALVNNSGCN